MPKKLTQEEVINQFIEAHGDKYDYSKVNYINGSTKVLILCKGCNTEFLQSPTYHKRGSGCSSCNKKKSTNSRMSSRPKTTEERIIQANEIHNNKFDYSLVPSETTAKMEISVICPEHGEFKTTWDRHVNNKRGCNKCTGKYKHTKEEVQNLLDNMLPQLKITKFIGYSSLNNELYCTTHNHAFKAQINNITSGNTKGCKFCNSKVVDHETLLAKLPESFTSKYTITSNYKDKDLKVQYMCELHGIQEAYVGNLLKGHACWQCHLDNVTTTKEQYIDKANKVHKGAFYYDKIPDQFSPRRYGKIEIYCKEHKGYFMQRGDTHLAGHGCPSCAQGPAYIYLLKENTSGAYKIGISTNIANRVSRLGRDFSIIASTKEKLANARTLESELHNKYKHLRTYTGAQIFDGSTEIFNLSEQQVQEVINYLESL